MAAEESVARSRSRRAPPEDQEFLVERDGASAAASAREPLRSVDPSRVSDPFRDPTDDNARSALPYPAAVARKYYIVPGPVERAGTRRAYADGRGEYLVFKDEGAKLATRREEAVVAHDLVAIAEHRAWPALKVTGSVAFRREVWIEAAARGLAVKGYEPTDLDRQALEKRRADRDQPGHRSGRAAGERLGPSGRERESASPGAEAALSRGRPPSIADGRGRTEPAVKDTRSVTDRFAEIGAALDRKRDRDKHPADEAGKIGNSAHGHGRESDSRGAVEAGGRRRVEPLHLERLNAETDRRVVRAVDVEQGSAISSPRLSERAPGTGERHRFRVLPRTEAVNEPNVAAAHSQLAVLDRALARAFPRDEATREAVLNVARERLALHLDQGNVIRRAEYALPVRDKAAERRQPERGPERETEPVGRGGRGLRERDR